MHSRHFAVSVVSSEPKTLAPSRLIVHHISVGTTIESTSIESGC